MHMTGLLVLIFNFGFKEVGFLVVVNEGLGWVKLKIGRIVIRQDLK